MTQQPPGPYQNTPGQSPEPQGYVGPNGQLPPYAPLPQPMSNAEVQQYYATAKQPWSRRRIIAVIGVSVAALNVLILLVMVLVRALAG